MRRETKHKGKFQKRIFFRAENILLTEMNGLFNQHHLGKAENWDNIENLTDRHFSLLEVYLIDFLSRGLSEKIGNLFQYF